MPSDTNTPQLGWQEMCEARRKVAEQAASASGGSADELLSPTRKAGRIDGVIAELAGLESRLQVVQVVQMGMVEQEKATKHMDTYTHTYTPHPRTHTF